MSCLAVRNNDMVRLKYGNNGKIYRPRPRYSIFAAAREPGATMACRIGDRRPARRLAMNDGATAGTAASNAPRPGPNRTVALIGLMGAGKSAVGKRLAKRLARAFTDADHEIERAAGCSIADFFQRYGEGEFRRGEERVIARLLEGPPIVLATGGGAFMSAVTRANLAARAVTVWLRADLELLFQRVARRSHRPLLNTADPRATLKSLMDHRYPVYGMADIVVDSANVAVEETTAAVERALADFWAAPKSTGGKTQS